MNYITFEKPLKIYWKSLLEIDLFGSKKEMRKCLGGTFHRSKARRGNFRRGTVRIPNLSEKIFKVSLTFIDKGI